MTASLGALNPIDHPEEWDVLVIGGVRSPGVCHLNDLKLKHEWDVKKGKGAQGGYVTYVGRPPSTFTARFDLWDNGTLGTGHNHFDEWDNFVELLQYDPTKKDVQAIDVYHPALAFVDLHSVVTESIGAPHHAGDGLFTIEVEFLEYIPPPAKSAVSTPSTSDSASKAKTPGVLPDPAIAALDKELGTQISHAQLLGPL